MSVCGLSVFAKSWMYTSSVNFVLSLGVFCCCVPAMFIYVCVVCLTMSIGEVMCLVVIIALMEIIVYVVCEVGDGVT